MSRIAEVMQIAIVAAKLRPEETVWVVSPNQKRAKNLVRPYPNLPENLKIKVLGGTT